MKKAFLIMAALLSIVALNGCADKRTESGSSTEFSDSPFSGSDSGQTSEPQADNYEELFGKYQTGSIKIGNYSLEGGVDIEYDGGDIEFSFDVSTFGNKYETETGYMAFINGIPQKLSLNGGERNELVRISQQPDQSSTITLSFTPTITEELAGEKTLQVKFMDIFNPSYEPSGSFVGFGNAHLGSPFFEFDIKVNSPLAVSEKVFETIKDKCESVLITDEISKKYKISKPGENRATTLSIIDEQTKEQLLTLRSGQLDAQILMYGSEPYKYRVYFYVNHERVKFNGGDYLETEIKNGYLNVFKPKFENINERDIIYAIAVPENAETGDMTLRKSGSVLVLDENNAPEDDSSAQPPVTSLPELPPETSENTQSEFDKITNIYSYNPEGYIDDEQRYLLLSRHSVHSKDPEYYAYIIYDNATNEVIGVLDAGDDVFDWEFTYGDGEVTLEHYNVIVDGALSYDENTVYDTVYNEKFEVLAEIRGDDVKLLSELGGPDCGPYRVKFLPAKNRWYFNLKNCFYTANEDFSKVTKIADFEIYKYYILEDRIVYYKVIADLQEPANNGDFFGVMDLDGNIISETKIASDGGGSFRIGKAGDTIYFMSGFRIDTNVSTHVPMDGIIFYDCKTGEQKTLYPEEDNENSFCKVTPNGKYLATGILVKENHYTYKDVIIKLYDIESGEMLESKAMGTGKESFLAMCAYNDRVILTNGTSVTYTFKSQ